MHHLESQSPEGMLLRLRLRGPTQPLSRLLPESDRFLKLDRQRPATAASRHHHQTQRGLLGSSSRSSLASLLGLCDDPRVVQQVHTRFVIHGLQQSPTLSSRLISRYAALRRPDLSLSVFHSLHHPDASLCAAVLRTLSSCGDSEATALAAYRGMVARSLFPDASAYPSLLQACSALQPGLQLHCHAIKLGLEIDAPVGSALVEMYGMHGEIGDAHRALEVMPVRDLVSWNAIISGASESGDLKESFRLLMRMRLEGLEPDSVIVVSLLRSCVDLDCLDGGRFLHVLIIMNGLGDKLSVSTVLLTMYCQLGSLETARRLFDMMRDKDCAVWNVMISGYSRNGHPELALQLLMRMAGSGVRTDLFTAIAALASVTELRSLRLGKQIHGHVIRNGSNSQVSVHNSLIEMYSKCKSPCMGRRVFDCLTDKTMISWSSMIKGYITNDCFSDALLLFHEMKMEGVTQDSITLINILPACVDLGALEQVKSIHGYSIKHGLSSITFLLTALLVSYAKCGCIEMAQKLFNEEEIHRRDIISWNSMIGAYSKHGNWPQCFTLYSQMKDLELVPDKVTFLGLLTACVNSGLVREGWKCFNEMVYIYSHQPEQEHYACMVDLLGHAGDLDEAINIIERIPFEPDEKVWGALLSACKLHSETRLAEFAAEKLMQMEPKNAGNYVLLSNIYAAAGKWDGVARMRSFLRGRGLKKNPGISWLQINGRVHEFRVMDQSHPKSQDLYTMLRILEQEIKDNAERMHRR